MRISLAPTKRDMGYMWMLRHEGLHVDTEGWRQLQYNR